MTSKTIAEFAARIEKATSHIEFIGNDGSPRKRDYIDEAKWYVGYQIAAQMRDEYTVKDWAYYVVEGMQPLTDTDVLTWFEAEGEPTDEQLVQWFHG